MPKHQQTNKVSPFSSYGLRSFLTFSKPWRSKILLVLVIFLLSNAALAFQPILVGRLIDAATNGLNSDAIWVYAALLILASVVHDLLWRAGEILYRGLLFGIGFWYETHLFQQVITKPYPYFVDKFTGKIGSYITMLSDELRWLLENAMYNYLSSFFSAVAVIAIMATVNWQTALIVATSLVFMIVIGRFTLAQDLKYKKIETDKSSTKNGYIIDAVANFVSIKSFHKEATERSVVDKQQHVTYEAARTSYLWGIVFWGSMSLVVRYFAWPAIVIYNVWLLTEGQITIGQFATVLSTAIVFTSTIWDAIWNASQFGLKIAKIEEAHTYLFGRVNIAEPKSLVRSSRGRVKKFTSHFMVRHLSFSYPDNPDSPVLADIQLTLSRGEKLGIVGKSGSGKSTLVKLLLNQYDLPNGTFMFDNAPVSGRVVSQNIAYVPQDTLLFHRSIAENIAYAAEGTVSIEDISAAAKKAEAHEFIMSLPEQYDTIVGERGVKLSGGQRQRIAIARAILRDAPLLVLDEATSALDSENEAHIQKALESLWQDKTVIAIAHRLSTLRNMDRIIVMHDGKITEQGTHKELFDRNGDYAKLWRQQSGGFIEE